MHTVAIIQARMGSSRLPGKVLANIAGSSMLGRVVERVRAAATIDDVVIATSTHTLDDRLVAEADRLGVNCFRGSEHDVLDRYIGAARAASADAIVRVTADCPLLDPGVIDLVVSALGTEVDYASNTHDRSYPRGLDCEAVHRDVLERIGRLASSPAAREHVTAFVMEQPGLFRCRQVVAHRDDSDLRWTVDTADDLALVRMLYALLGAPPRLPYTELVAAIRSRPQLKTLNAHVIQKPWEGPVVP